MEYHSLNNYKFQYLPHPYQSWQQKRIAPLILSDQTIENTGIVELRELLIQVNATSAMKERIRKRRRALKSRIYARKNRQKKREETTCLCGLNNERDELEKEKKQLEKEITFYFRFISPN